MTDHLQANWVYYLWAMAIFLAVGITFLLYWVYNLTKAKMRRTRLRRKLTRTYVVPRDIVSRI
jgi:hypothetical protein